MMSLFDRCRRWSHDRLGWGYPDKMTEVGFMPIYSCRFCSGRITMDGQGNWFHLPSRGL